MYRRGVYRLTSITGAAVIVSLIVVFANSPLSQSAVSSIPVLSTLPTESAEGTELLVESLLTTGIVLAACFPLYKPRPRRILDTVTLTHKRVFISLLAMATLGYFDYTYRLPRLTLILVTPCLLSALPIWFVWLRKRPTSGGGKQIVVGDEYEMINQVVSETEINFIGYLCPTASVETQPKREENKPSTMADGGMFSEMKRLGGLARIRDVLLEHNVDTVVLAFAQSDRAEFFGVLDACYDHGVDVKVHQTHADTVLTGENDAGALVSVDVKPWDAQDYLLKRGFDILFATTGLIILSPIIMVIAILIKLEDGGPVLYRQERTALFGDTFDVYKFRSMVENAEAQTGATISDEDDDGFDPRVTRVGRILRQTHMDEIPQLWSVLRGDMSVVGPRPERPELDTDIRREGVVEWQKRWFVKPGLTGPAQVNGVTGAEPEQKIRYDLLYVRRQSIIYDTKMIIRQVWKVIGDIAETFNTL